MFKTKIIISRKIELLFAKSFKYWLLRLSKKKFNDLL